MKTIFIILLSFFSYIAFGQNDTIVFTGINGKLVTADKADWKKEVNFRSRGRIIVTTFSKKAGKWQRQYREQFRRTDNNEFNVKTRGTGISENFIRKFENTPDGMYKFSDYKENLMFRSGFSKTRFPLLLHGEMTEYYRNNQIKSTSVFSKNELISNENWNETGDKYIDNIFYSVDNEPLFSKGMNEMHRHVSQSFRESGVDLASISGSILIGFVVMEDGDIDGIRVLKGITPGLNALAINAIKTLEGNWTPAKLNGKNIRYFQLFPINFIYRETRFDAIEFTGTMLHWENF
jgi:periplasmic protein TonB